MDNNNSELINLLSKCKNKSVTIVLKSGFHYDTKNLKIISGGLISFIDRRGDEIMIAVSEIAQIIKRGFANAE